VDHTTIIDRKRLHDRFATGLGMQGRLMRALLDDASGGPVLQAGARIGPWKILELLGTGGMSHVYLAERCDGAFEQQVALKLVRRNADLIHRLRHERQLIAHLRHPHIVSLIDSDETAEGDLWLAMGLVEGLPVDEYAQQHELDWRARVQLVDAVCAAVEYAHGRGLIHRDIKPSNVLVDAQGHPRLLDFGIAFEQGAATTPDHALTPGFAAPEQIAGQPLTTATDVFQLGLLLQRVWAAGVTPLSAPRAVQADLDALMRRATAGDPAQRHATAAALRTDLDALLARRPLAHQMSQAWPRLARFAERHRLPLAIGSMATLTLAVSLTLAALQLRDERDRALSNEARAQGIAKFLIDTLATANPWDAEAGGGTLVEAMDRAAEKLDSELAQSLDVRRELRKAIASVYQATDRYDRCLNLLAKPAADSERAAATPLQQAELALIDSKCHFATDQREAAWSLLDAAEQSLAGTRGAAADGLRAALLVERGEIRSFEGKLQEANGYMEAVLALGLGSEGREHEFSANRQLAFNLFAAKDYSAAATRFERALALGREVHGPTHRSTLTTAGGYAMVLERLGRAQEAETLLRQTIAVAEGIRAKGGEPQMAVAVLRDNLATVLFQQARLDECIVEARAALEVYQREAPDTTRGYNPSWRIASCAYMLRQLDVAGAHAEMALQFASKGIPVGIINSERMLAAVAARRGEYEQASQHLARADEALARAEMASTDVGTAVLLTHALLAAKRGEHDAAVARLGSVSARMRSATPPRWLAQEHADVSALVNALAPPRTAGPTTRPMR
jgi:serine/threonine-protein kinase